MGRASWPSLLVMLLVLAASAHADIRLFGSSSSDGPSKTHISKADSRDEGAKSTEHHPQIVVTGAEVGVAVSPDPSPKPTGDAAAEQPAANLLGDLISAASDKSNDTIGQVLDKALAKEFAEESKNAESGKGKTFNETVASEEVRGESSWQCSKALLVLLQLVRHAGGHHAPAPSTQRMS